MTKEDALNLKPGDKFLYLNPDFPHVSGRIWTVIKLPRYIDEYAVSIECEHKGRSIKLGQYEKMIKI